VRKLDRALMAKLCAPLHRFKFAMIDIRSYFKIAFLAAIVVDMYLFRFALKPLWDSSFSS
jgi:hypothetical protein